MKNINQRIVLIEKNNYDKIDILINHIHNLITKKGNNIISTLTDNKNIFITFAECHDKSGYWLGTRILYQKSLYYYLSIIKGIVDYEKTYFDANNFEKVRCLTKVTYFKSHVTQDYLIHNMLKEYNFIIEILKEYEKWKI